MQQEMAKKFMPEVRSAASRFHYTAEISHPQPQDSIDATYTLWPNFRGIPRHYYLDPDWEKWLDQMSESNRIEEIAKTMEQQISQGV